MHILTELAQQITNSYMLWNKKTSRTIVTVKNQKMPKLCHVVSPI